MSQAKLSILVTGVGGRSVGHQILHGLLSMGSKYRVVACDADPFAYGLYEVSDRYQIPRADSQSYLDTILSIAEREKIDVILPGTEPEVLVLADAAPTLHDRGCTVVVNPRSVVQLCSNKATLYEWLSANGFGVPKSAPLSEWSSLAATCGFPLVAKPTTMTGGSRGVALLNSEEEVTRYVAALPPSVEVVFQEYIDGPESEYTVGVMISKSGELIDSIVMHRRLVGMSLGVERVIANKLYALSTGYSQGYIISDTFIQSECEQLAMRIGARGPMNIQCRVNDCKLFVFEVHPRFSGTSSFRADVGFNEPDILIRNFHFDEQFMRIPYRTNVAAIRALSNIVVPLEEMAATRRAVAPTGELCGSR
jgi:carbamoyl-phosphate synthase large subunit